MGGHVGKNMKDINGFEGKGIMRAVNDILWHT